MSNEKIVISDDGLKKFCELSVNVLNKHAPRKKKYARGNQVPFFTKEFLKKSETLNNFFGNVIKDLMIPKYNEYDPSIDRVENRTIRAILKYRNHPSILAIRERKKAQINFCFKEVSIEEIQKEILNLNNKKASQNSNIPTKIIKENSDIFGKSFIFFYQRFDKVIYIPTLLQRGRRYTNSQK